MKAVVIGCGRVGSAVAKARADGWDVTAVDENEDALVRLGPDWRGGFVVGHGMDIDVLEKAGIEDADAAVVATDGDNTNVVIGQVLQKRFGVDPSSPASSTPRARSSTRSAGCAPCARPRRRSPSSSTTVRRRDGRKRGPPDVRHRRGRRQGRRERDAVASRDGARGHAHRAAPDRFDLLQEEFGPVVMLGDATEIFVLERAGIARPPDLVLAVTGDDEDNLVISQIARGLRGPKVIARVNDPRNQEHFDLLGITQTVCATSGILGLVEHEVPEHGLVRLLELRRRASTSSRCRSTRLPGRPASGPAGSASGGPRLSPSCARAGPSSSSRPRCMRPGDQVLAVLPGRTDAVCEARSSASN